MLPAYAELHCVSNFTFLRGASHPDELVTRAARLGYSALAITDECSLAGVVRAHVAAKAHHLKLIVGAEFRLADGAPASSEQGPRLRDANVRESGAALSSAGTASVSGVASPKGAPAPPSDGARIVLLASDRDAYGNLSELITTARRRGEKGSYRLHWNDLSASLNGCLALLIPAQPTTSGLKNTRDPIPSLIPACRQAGPALLPEGEGSLSSLSLRERERG